MCRLFLEENEPVIAKYRGAWYEARIVMVERQAICKIYFKTDPRKTEFTVHLNHLLVAESATHQLRLFIRIQQNDPEEIELIGFRDVSTYTVEFPDGITERLTRKHVRPLHTSNRSDNNSTAATDSDEENEQEEEEETTV